MKAKIGYLISQYPAVSHTFIQREIVALRKKGWEIYTVSINAANLPPGNRIISDQQEYDKTYYVKRQGVLISFVELLKMIVNSPLRLIKGFYISQTLAKMNIRQMFYNLFYLGEALLIAKWMKQKEIKHLHVHFANAASTVALILTKIYPCSYSITVHGPDEFYDVSLNNLKEKLEGAKFIFCISYYTRSQILRLIACEEWDTIDVVPLGVDTDMYRPNELKKDSSTFKILCVGRMVISKGQRILLEAVQHLLSLGKEINLLYVGEGPERNILEKTIKDFDLQNNVIIKGALNSDETFELYKNADLFVLISFAEGLPVVLMEAMSMEIPCIATAINGIPELINNEINGLLVRPSNIDDVIGAILRLLEDTNFRAKMGKAGRLTILEKYNLTKNIDHLTECFEKRLKG